jgi:hypothetical protein
MCSCSSFDLLLLRGFVTSGIRAQGFKIDLLSERLSAALPGSTVQRQLDQQLQFCIIKQASPRYCCS